MGVKNSEDTSKQRYILAFPPPGGGNFLSKLKNGEEFEGGLNEKRKGKEEKRG